MHRRVVDQVDFRRVLDYRWMGDLYLVYEAFQRGLRVRPVPVETSGSHGGSTIFDYAGAISELTMGIPILKMKELVDHFGLPLDQLRRRMLQRRRRYLPSVFAANGQAGRCRSGVEIKSFMDFIVSQYYRTADIYDIRL